MATTINPTHPLDLMFKEIKSALNSGMLYLAVSTCLTIPDICAAMESTGGQASGAKYKTWYNKYLASVYPKLTDVDCYSLRCGLLHQGRMGHPKSQYARVLFSLPNPQNNVYHNNVINDALNLDAIRFCDDVIQASKDWFDTMHNDPNVVANMDRVVRLRPNGLAPYMVGMPILA